MPSYRVVSLLNWMVCPPTHIRASALFFQFPFPGEEDRLFIRCFELDRVVFGQPFAPSRTFVPAIQHPPPLPARSEHPRTRALAPPALCFRM